MQLIKNLNTKLTAPFSALSDGAISLFARFTFAAVLLMYFWKSGLTKLGDGFGGLFALNLNAYAQIFPKAMEAAGYDPSQLSIIHKMIAMAGTWAEFILPALLLLGLLTRLAALGMMGFIAVQTWVDVNGHGAAFGSWFNNQSGELIADQRLLWIFLLVVLLIKGGGLLSLDRALKLDA